MTDTETVVVTIANGKDARGNPASLPAAVPTWSVSDATILSVVPAADGMSASVSAAGATGTAQVTAVDGTASQSADVTIVGGPAKTFDLNFSTPTQQAA